MLIKETERNISLSPVQIYQKKLKNFQEKQERILTSPDFLSPPPTASFLERIGLKKPKPVFLPLAPSKEEKLSELKAEFESWLHSDRQMIVSHLMANPKNINEILTSYRQSEEVLKDENNFQYFFQYWFLEFFQQVETGPRENLPDFIMKVNPESLPRELQSAKKRIFNPFFRLCEESLLDSLKEDLKTLGFSLACQKLAKRVIKENFPFTNSLKEGYLNFVEDLVKLEAGFVQEKVIIAGLKTPPYQSGDESPRIYTSPERKRGRFSPAHINLSSERYERKLRTLSPEKFIRPEKSKSMGVPQGRSSLPSLPASKDGEKQKEENIHPLSAHSFFIVLGPKSPPVKIENLEQLRQVMRKIKSCGPMTPEIVWRSLLGLREMTPLEVIERYAEQVTGGPFEGWHKILKGNKWMILFEIRDQKIMFRVGSHKDVYAIKKRREPPDKSRRL